MIDFREKDPSCSDAVLGTLLHANLRLYSGSSSYVRENDSIMEWLI